MKLQVNTAGSWKALVDFDSDRREEVVRALHRLDAALGSGAKWSLVDDDGKRDWLELPAPPAERAKDANVELRTALDRSPMLKKFLAQGFWHAHYVDIVWRFNGEDVREQADWLKDLFYLVRQKPTIEQLEHALTRTDLKVEMLPDGSVIAVEKERPDPPPSSKDESLRAALEKDAARYRWLKTRINWREVFRNEGPLGYACREWAHVDLRRHRSDSEHIDEYVDAALAGNEGAKSP